MPANKKINAIIQLTRLDRPIGIWLLLWPMLWALWFAAGGFPDIRVLGIFVLGTILMRSAGCAINDYADRDFDAHVARTSQRPLATGALTGNEALLVAAGFALVSFLLVLMTNRLTILLSFIGVVLAAVYPFMKRVTDWPQIVLGAAFAWAIPMAWAAQTGHLEAVALLLFLIAVVWAVAYDTLYAMADREDDIKIGIRSTATLLGDRDLWLVASMQCVVLLGMAGIGRYFDRGAIYYAGLLIAAGFACYQLYIARHRDPQQCVRAFLNNNYLGMAIFLGIVIDFWRQGTTF